MNIKKGRKCLRKSSERFEKIFHGFLEVAPDAVAIIDKSGKIVQFNGQAERLFGYDRSEVLGNFMEMLMPARFRTGHITHRITYNADLRPRSMGSGLNLLGTHKDGREFPIDVMLSPLNTKVGIFIACAVHDMTIHRNMENELRRKSEELEEADRQKDSFVAVVMHELRGPLSVLTNIGALLQMPEIGLAGRQKAMLALERQTNHMLRLVNDLMDVSKMRGGKLKLEKEIFDLRTIVAKAVEISHVFLDGGEHKLTIEQCGVPLQVNGDSLRLVQVLSNLLTNAAKYTPRGGRITITTEKNNKCALILVQDNGEGIPANMLNRVFNLFTQVERLDSRIIDGMEIGLSLVERLVHLHLGTVIATSEGQGKGSLFTVTLPLHLNSTTSFYSNPSGIPTTSDD
ncbi:PAS domain-containing sensor histidine kinase [Massilia sp. DWR3-1-1]|uniref:PAS domain-containing sensor histidine kinase n=1 Tax=Massilia sp. DWR3-1-1 TaxID=2804559 RepID=UPI003CEE19CA